MIGFLLDPRVVGAIVLIFVLPALLVLLGAERHGPIAKGRSPGIVTRKKWWRD
jgi:hypothetical protein